MDKMTKSGWEDARKHLAAKDMGQSKRNTFGALIQGYLDEGGVNKHETKEVFKYLEKHKGEHNLSDRDIERFKEEFQRKGLSE